MGGPLVAPRQWHDSLACRVAPLRPASSRGSCYARSIRCQLGQLVLRMRQSDRFAREQEARGCVRGFQARSTQGSGLPAPDAPRSGTPRGTVAAGVAVASVHKARRGQHVGARRYGGWHVRSHRPWATTGWALDLGTLPPVSGAQSHTAQRAERARWELRSNTHLGRQIGRAHV